MKSRNTIATLTALAAVCGAALAPAAHAQRSRDRDDDWNGRNRPTWRDRDSRWDGSGRDRRDRDARRNPDGRDWRDTDVRSDRFGRYSRLDVDRLIDRVERDSNAFRAAFERAMRGGAVRDNDRNDDLKRDIQRLDESLERLRREFDRSDSWRETRSRVSDVLARARPVERALDGRSRFDGAARRQWASVRSDLNALASAYDLSPVR